MDGITNSRDLSLSKLRERVLVIGAWGAAVHGVAKVGLNCVTELKLKVRSNTVG